MLRLACLSSCRIRAASTPLNENGENNQRVQPDLRFMASVSFVALPIAFMASCRIALLFGSGLSWNASSFFRTSEISSFNAENALLSWHGEDQRNSDHPPKSPVETVTTVAATAASRQLLL